jgi:hypothetical protein
MMIFTNVMEGRIKSGTFDTFDVFAVFTELPAQLTLDDLS